MSHGCVLCSIKENKSVKLERCGGGQAVCEESDGLCLMRFVCVFNTPPSLPPLRYGYHITKNSYFICHDQNAIRKLFDRLRNFEGENSYPKECQGFSITAVRDLTTGYDSNQADHKAVRAAWPFTGIYTH